MQELPPPPRRRLRRSRSIALADRRIHNTTSKPFRGDHKPTCSWTSPHPSRYNSCCRHFAKSTLSAVYGVIDRLSWRPVEVPLSRRLQLAAPAAEGQALHPVDFEFAGPCERCSRMGNAKVCSFVKTLDGSETITRESGYGGTSHKRKYERKSDTSLKKAKLGSSGVSNCEVGFSWW